MSQEQLAIHLGPALSVNSCEEGQGCEAPSRGSSPSLLPSAQEVSSLGDQSPNDSWSVHPLCEACH